jgi:hypothetical protein
MWVEINGIFINFRNIFTYKVGVVLTPYSNSAALKSNEKVLQDFDKVDSIIAEYPNAVFKIYINNEMIAAYNKNTFDSFKDDYNKILLAIKFELIS